jgi:hypothetical protein
MGEGKFVYVEAGIFRIAGLGIVLCFSMLACISSSAPTSQSEPSLPLPPSSVTESSSSSNSPSAQITAEPQSKPGFKTAVIADTSTEQVTREQAQNIINEASGFLTEFTPYGLEMVDFVEDGSGGSTRDMVNRYLTGHATNLPNGIVLFSFGDGGQARLSGGYGYSVPAENFQNTFVSPVVGANQIYIAVVDFKYKYMACGYGSSENPQSPTSMDGECNNQPGTACVQQNGYSMCANAVGNLYMSTPTHFVSSAIIRGLLHNFGAGGEQDNYDAPECKAKMILPANYFDLQESEYNNGLCPFIYEDFTKSYQP